MITLCAPLQTFAPPNPITGHIEEWSEPDGTHWVTTLRAIQIHNELRGGHGTSWPHLWEMAVEVTPDVQSVKIPGKVRTKRGSLPRPSREFPRRAYEESDVREAAMPPDPAAEFKAHERQQATKGKYKGRWFIGPAVVAERLKVHFTYVCILRKNGIPWALDRHNKKRKPVTQPFKNGYYGRHEDFWLEEEVEEFRTAREDTPEALPDDLMSLSDVVENRDAGPVQAAQRRNKKEFGSRVTVTKRREKVPGKREFFFTVRQRAIIAEDVKDYRDSRTTDPVPVDRITVKALASVFRVTECTILRWINHGTSWLDGAKLPKIDGPVLCEYRWKGKPLSYQRDGAFLVDKRAAQRLWKRKYPDRPIPKRLMIPGNSATDAASVPLAEARPRGGDGATMTPPATRESTAPTATSAVVKYPALGIEVNIATRVVCGGGKSVDLSRSAVQWHIFQVALESFPNAFSIESVLDKYPGEKDDVARRMATKHLNDKLTVVKIGIWQRVLGKLPE